MDSQPYSATIRRKRCAISSSASSQEMRSKACVGTAAPSRPSGAQLRSHVARAPPPAPQKGGGRVRPPRRFGRHESSSFQVAPSPLRKETRCGEGDAASRVSTTNLLELQNFLFFGHAHLFHLLDR